MLKLVKDFEDYQFVYYWVDKKNSKVSANLPTRKYAQEWIIHHSFEEYEGSERRRSIYDRRYSANKINLHGSQIFFSKRKALVKGRRMTDRAVAVDLDLSKEKLNNLSAL